MPTSLPPVTRLPRREISIRTVLRRQYATNQPDGRFHVIDANYFEGVHIAQRAPRGASSPHRRDLFESKRASVGLLSP